ncbi:fimbrial protein [Yokenella regensburgei]|uniref:fimbrial protein n=1 Tax=Yokenella regensburgei TaxID=158877 RepID=UPI003F163EA0
MKKWNWKYLSDYQDKKSLLILFLITASAVFFPATAEAFFFGTSYNGYLTINADDNIEKLGNVTSSNVSSEAKVWAEGWPDTNSRDRVIITDVSVNSEFTNKGFTVEMKIGSGSWGSASSRIYSCVWPDRYCSVYGSPHVQKSYTEGISVRLKRNSMTSYTPIRAGTNIAIVWLAQYSNSGVSTAKVYLYTQSNAITVVNPTCDVTGYDELVTLPSVMRSDIQSQGPGRYSAAQKDFSIKLQCTDKPKVSIKFKGDPMSGVATNDVLTNSDTANNNIGIQMVYNNNAVKVDETIMQVSSAAAASEELKFKAYYYYKGGEIKTGPVRSQAEFLVSYN